MIIKPSAMLRNDYSSISKLAKTSKEPIYITKNGEGDGVFMREQLLDLRFSVLEAEEERLSGKPTMSISEAREALARRRYGK